MSDAFTMLYYPQRTVLISANEFSGTRNMPFNITRKTIYKGVDSTLGFDVKNQDRKPVNLLGKSVTVNFMNVRTGQLILQRQAKLVKPESGYCEFTVFGNDLATVDPGYYQISVVLSDSSGISHSLFTDNNRKATLEIELLDGAYPKFVASDIVSFYALGSDFYSQALVGNIPKNDNDTLHTIQITTTNYSGTVSVLGSLEYASTGDYFVIDLENGSDSISYVNSSQTRAYNFNTNARWIKIKHSPSVSNTGTVDKIVYRN